MLDHVSCTSLAELLLDLDHRSTNDTAPNTTLNDFDMAGSDREQDETSVPASSQATLIPSTQADRGSSITSHLRTPAGTAVEYINPVVNSETQTTSSELSFVDALEKERGVLDDDYKNFEEDVKTRDTTENDLDELIWSDLQAEYEKDVAALALEEADLMKKFDARFKVCVVECLGLVANKCSNLCCGWKCPIKERANGLKRGMCHVEYSRVF